MFPQISIFISSISYFSCTDDALSGACAGPADTRRASLFTRVARESLAARLGVTGPRLNAPSLRYSSVTPTLHISKSHITDGPEDHSAPFIMCTAARTTLFSLSQFYKILVICYY